MKCWSVGSIIRSFVILTSSTNSRVRKSLPHALRSSSVRVFWRDSQAGNQALLNWTVSMHWSKPNTFAACLKVSIIYSFSAAFGTRLYWSWNPRILTVVVINCVLVWDSASWSLRESVIIPPWHSATSRRLWSVAERPGEETENRYYFEKMGWCDVLY